MSQKERERESEGGKEKETAEGRIRRGNYKEPNVEMKAIWYIPFFRPITIFLYFPIVRNTRILFSSLLLLLLFFFSFLSNYVKRNRTRVIIAIINVVIEVEAIDGAT